MLRKLYKHEFVSLYRVLLPLYGLLFGLSAVVRILSMISGSSDVITLIFGLTVFLTILLAIGVMFAGFILVITNFYKTLLGKQGYLTFCLPFKVKDHIFCKLICGIVTVISTFAAEIIALMILLSDYDILKNLFDAIKTVFHVLNFNYGAGKVTIVCFEIAFLVIASVTSNLLMFFASMAMGQQFKRRVLGAVGMYFAIYISVEIVLSLFLRVFASFFNDFDLLNGFWVLQEYFLFLFIVLVAQALLYFFLTNHFLSKKLNLE